MADKQIQVTLSINADTSKAKMQLQSLQQQLTNLVNSTAGGKELYLTKEIQEAVSSAEQLKIMLQSATNVDTGRLDLGKFSTQLKSSGRSLEQFSTNLIKLGPQGEQAFATLAQSIASADTKIVHTSKLLNNLWTTMKTAVSYRISYGAINTFTNGISKAYSYAQNLNESLNNIRIVTGKSAEEMDKFAKTANKAAKALNTTTTDYTDAALIFYQQGLGDDLVKEYTDTTIKMANVSGDSATTVSSYMTSIWNNFNKAGDESAEHFADVLTALGASTASSTSEIAGGLEKFASVADTVGLSYDYAASALATIVAQTRQSEDTVGTALKTIFARLQDLELEGSVTDEDGVTTSLGQYSQALEKVGVQVLDTNGNMRDMDDILDDLGKKWDTLSGAQQTALAQNVAGTRQYTQLVALMDNWDSFQTNLSTAQNADGSLQEQADIYAESWAAAKDKVTASAQGIYDSIINDDFFIDATNKLADFLGFIEKIVDSLGGMSGVISALGLILTKVFSAQLTETFNAGILNIRNNLGITEAEAAATSKQMVEIYAKNWANSGSAADKMKQENFENEIKYTREISNLRGKISEESEKYLEFLKETAKYTGEEAVNAKETAAKATEKAEKATTSLYGKDSGLAALGYTEDKIKDKVETAQKKATTVSNFNHNYDNTDKILNSRQSFRSVTMEDMSAFNVGDSGVVEAYTAACNNYNKALQDYETISQEVQNSEQVSEDQKKRLTEAEKDLTDAIGGVEEARKAIPESTQANIAAEELENQIIEELIGEKGQEATQAIETAKSKESAAEKNLNAAKKEQKEAQNQVNALKKVVKSKKEDSEASTQLKEAQKRLADAEKDVKTRTTELTNARKKAKKVTIENSEAAKKEKENIEKVRKTVKGAVQSYQEKTSAEQDSIEADQQHVNSLNNLQNALNKVKTSSITLGEVFSKVTSGMMSLGMAISSISSIKDTLEDDTLSTWEKFEQILMSVSMVMMALPSVFSAVKAAKDLFTGSSIKATLATTMEANANDILEKAEARGAVTTALAAAAQEVKEKGAKASLSSLIKLAAANYLNSKAEGADTIATFAATVAQEGFNAAIRSNPIGAFLTLILAVIVALASLAAILIACATQETKAHKELTQLNNTLQAATTAYENAKTAAEEFKDAISDYDDAIDSLDELAKGTQEYADKLEEANEKAKELISTYNLSAEDYEIKDGVITIKQEALDEKQNELDEKEYIALAAKEAIQIERDNAQDKNDWFESEYSRSKGFNLYGGNEEAYEIFTNAADTLSDAIDNWNADSDINEGMTISKEDLNNSLNQLSDSQLANFKSSLGESLSDSSYSSIVDQLIENKNNESDLFETYMGDDDTIEATQALADAIYAENKDALVEEYGSEAAAQVAAYNIAATQEIEDVNELSKGYSTENTNNDLTAQSVAYDKNGYEITLDSLSQQQEEIDNIREENKKEEDALYDEYNDLYNAGKIEEANAKEAEWLIRQEEDNNQIAALEQELFNNQTEWGNSGQIKFDASDENLEAAILGMDENATDININRQNGKITYTTENDEGESEEKTIKLKGSSTDSDFLSSYQNIMTQQQYETAGKNDNDETNYKALLAAGVDAEAFYNTQKASGDGKIDAENFIDIFGDDTTGEELKEILTSGSKIQEITQALGNTLAEGVTINVDDFEDSIDTIITAQNKKYYSNQAEVAGKGYTDSGSVISKLQSGDLDVSNIASDADFSDLLTQIDTLRDRSEILQGDFAILNETWLAGTDAYTDALKEAQEELYSLNLEALEQQNSLSRTDIADTLTKLKSATEDSDITDYVDTLRDKLDDLVQNDYTIIMDIQTNSEDVYNQIKTQLTDIESAADKIGENYIVAADDITTVGDAFPGILDQCTYLTDGTIKLNAEVVKSAMGASEAEQAEAIDAAITQIETNNAMLEAKKNGYESMLKIANEYISRQANSEEDYTEYSKKIAQASAQAQVDYDTDKANYIAENQNTEVENTNEANSAMAESTANLANSMANALTQAYAKAAEARDKWISGATSDSIIAGYTQDIASNFIGTTASTNSESKSKTVSSKTDDEAGTISYLDSIKQDAADYSAIIGALDDAINENTSEITSLNALANKTAKTYDDVSSGTNSSSSSSSSSDDDREADEAEKYHEQKQELAALESAYNKLGTAIDNAYGADKTSLIEQQTENLKKQKDVINEELALAQQYYQMDAGQFKSLTEQLVGMEAVFDEDGNLTNYTELMNAVGAAYVNGDISEEAYEQWKDKLSDVEGDIDSVQEYSESSVEKAAAIIQSRLDAIDNTVQVQIDIDDYDLKILEYLVDQLGDGLDDGLDKLELYSKEAADDLESLEATKTGISSILSQAGADQGLIDRMLSGTSTKEDYTWMSANLTGTEVEQLRTYGEQLIEEATSLDEVKEKIYELSSLWTEGNEDLDKQVKKIQDLSKVSEHYKNIIDTLGSETLDPTGEALQAIADNAYEVSKSTYEALQSQQEYLQSVKSGLQEALDAATDPEEIRTLTEQLEDVEDEIQANQESLYSTYEELCTNLVNTYSTALTQIVKDFEDSIAGARASMDDLQDIYEKQKDLADDYVADYEKIYQLTKLNRQVNEKIDNVSSLASKQRLLGYEQEINELLNNDQELSEYDIEYMEKKLALIDAQNALEDAQNAKSQVRMTRDSNGNYGYVYTADSEAVDDAQQEYETRLYEMQKANDEYIQSLQDSIVELSAEASEALAAINVTDYATIEEYQAKCDEVQAYYTEKMEYYEQQMGNVMDNNKELYNVDWVAYNELTGYKISADKDYVDSFDETTYSLVTGFSTMEEAATTFETTLDTQFGLAAEAADSYYQRLDGTLALAGTSVDTFSSDTVEKMEDVETEAGEVAKETEQMEKDMSEAYDGIISSVKTWATEVGNKYSAICSQSLTTADNINKITSATQALNSTDLSAVTNQYLALAQAAQTASTAAEQVSGSGSGNSGSSTSYTIKYQDGTGGPKTQTFSSFSAAKSALGTIYKTGTIAGGSTSITNNSTGESKSLGSWNELNKTSSFDTGGYTGSWGSDGKLAMLHQKELVLNESDTENMLAAVDIIRQIVDTIDLNAASASGGLGALTTATADTQNSTLEQNVTITAEFPNATDRNEILAAFENIRGLASQYANRK